MTQKNQKPAKPVEVSMVPKSRFPLKRFDLLIDDPPKYNINPRPIIPLVCDGLFEPKNDVLVSAIQADKRREPLAKYEKRELMDAIRKVNPSNPITNVLLAKIAQAESLPKRVRQAAKGRLGE